MNSRTTMLTIFLLTGCIVGGCKRDDIPVAVPTGNPAASFTDSRLIGAWHRVGSTTGMELAGDQTVLRLAVDSTDILRADTSEELATRYCTPSVGVLMYSSLIYVLRGNAVVATTSEYWYSYEVSNGDSVLTLRAMNLPATVPYTPEVYVRGAIGSPINDRHTASSRPVPDVTRRAQQHQMREG